MRTIAPTLGETTDSKIAPGGGTDEPSGFGQPAPRLPFLRRLQARLRQPFRDGPRAEPNSQRRWYFHWTSVSFLICVAIPSIVLAIYFVFIASAQYVVETRFIVRSPEVGSNTADSISSVMATVSSALSFSPNAQNAHVVAQYIRSRAAIDDAEQILNVREVFRRPEADFWAKLKVKASSEDLLDYWRGMVRVYVDTPSSIISVHVHAVRAEDALALSHAILKISERLVNRISEKAREDVMRSSEEDVRRAYATMRSNLQDIQGARNAEGTLDPIKTAEDTAKLLMQLMAEKARIDADLHFAKYALDKNAPTVRQLEVRAKIIDDQVAQLKSTLAGRELDRNVAAALRRFEELEIQRVLADKMLTFAEQGLERARLRAERQNLYFMVFVQPISPQDPTRPLRVTYSLLMPLGCLVLWAMFALIWAAVEDHRI